MPVRLVIFDLDGTLAQLPIDWDELREEVRELLGTDHPLKPLGPSIPQAAAGDEGLIREAFRLVEAKELEAARKARPDDLLRKLMERLRKKGVRIALVTLQARKPAMEALRRLGLLDLFDLIVTRERSLSRAEQLRMVLSELTVDANEAIFVGDTPWDVESAEEVGLTVLIVGERAKGDLNFSSVRSAIEYILKDL